MTTRPKPPTHLAFARNLRTAMNQRGLTQAALVERAQVHAPKTHPISRSNVSEYRNGKKMPGPVRLNAIVKALGVEIGDLVPVSASRTRTPLPSHIDEPASHTEIIDQGHGKARLRLDRVIPWEAVPEVMAILNRNPKGPT